MYVKASPTCYNTRDIVRLLQEAKKVGVAPKLERKFDGPFVIEQKLSLITFRVQVSNRSEQRLAHHDEQKMVGNSEPK